MIIFPAIDIKDRRVVRLAQGRFDKVTAYDADPVRVARQWAQEGADWLHVVDLDGARTEKIVNLDLISRIVREVPIPVQMGGGIRSLEDVQLLISAGVGRVILGTQAVTDLRFLREVLSRWPDQIAVSVDCRAGKVTRRGWTEVTDTNAVDFVRELELLGLRCLIYTDISTDGMLSGPNFAALEELLEATGVPLIASGGISSIEDVQKLRQLESRGLIGAITGKALYEGTLRLKEAIAACSQNA